MLYLFSIILGLIQALTEFLPISSSAHLILARAWLDFDFVDGLTFDVGLHVGTLLAILIYFHSDLAGVVRGLFRGGKGTSPRMAWYIAAACVPAAIAGLTFESAIEIYFRHPAVIVVTLVLGGLLFLWVEKLKPGTRRYEDMTLKSAVLIGLAQTLALIPGVSRSGITIVTGMVEKLKREEAARFSFLMVVPLLAGAGAKKGLDLSHQTMADGELTVFFVGLVTSALAGWLVIKFLLGFLRTHSLALFAWYRFALAAVVAAFLWLPM